MFLLLCALGFAMSPDAAVAQLTCASYAIDFDGTNDAIEFDGITTNDEMTIEFWFYPGSTDREEAILSSLDDGSYHGYQIYHEVNGDGAFWFIRMESDEGYTAAVGIPDIGSSWYHIAIIFTPSATTYLVNGEGNSEGEGWFLHDISLLETFPTTLHFGAGVDVAYFSGMLDEFRIWSRALTGDEIRSNMYAHLTGSEDNLVTYFPFDEGSGTTTANAASSSNNGTLQNGPAWYELNYAFNDCDECTNPNVTTQPVDASALVGDDVSFDAASSDADSPTLQWQRSTNGGADWSNLSSETSSTLTVDNVTMSMSGYRYRTAFTNDCGTTLSNEAALTVKVDATDLGPVDICIGSSTGRSSDNRMDLLVELFKNSTKIYEGTALNQRVLGSNYGNAARMHTVSLSQLVSTIEFEADDELICRVSVRRNGGSDDYPLQLWYNSSPSTGGGGVRAFSRIHKHSDFYYFRTGDALSQTAGSSPEDESLTTSTSYQVLGEWSMVGSAMKRGGRVTLNTNTELSAQLISQGNGTLVRFTAPGGTVTMSLFDVTGRRVQAFSPIEVSAGSTHEALIPHAGLSAGVYTLIISNGASRETLRFAVIQ